MQWFEIDKNGLAQLLAKKGKQFVIHELLSNAWDENSSQVEVSLERVSNSRLVKLVVTDDNPAGFSDLAHSYTLFAASSKKSHAEKRGRFNLGEKLVLALCEEASIVSTLGGVVFDKDGRRTLRRKTEKGSVFTGLLRMTNAEMLDCNESIAALIPPQGIKSVYNGQVIQQRSAVLGFEATLQTEIADAEGNMRLAQRKCRVDLVEPHNGESAMLYEMGVPVVETNDRWHVNVSQKIPLNFDRDNVPPAYLTKLRALVFEKSSHLVTTDDVNQPWVRTAIQAHGSAMPADAIKAFTSLRFGDKAVAYDPSDLEANHLAVASGYALVHGGSLSRPEWDAVRQSGALLPAGQVTPSPKPYSDNGDPLKIIPRSHWTDEMRGAMDYVQRLAPLLIEQQAVTVKIANDLTWPFLATYGKSSGLTFNLGRLGHKWFGGPLMAINDLLIHELGHHYCSNHLSSDYYAALTNLGAKMVALALEKPELFNRIVVD